MPQIGWCEILIIVALASLVIGPKDFPVVLKKVGGWIGSVKRYFNAIQKDVIDVQSNFEKEISIKEDKSNKTKVNEKDE